MILQEAIRNERSGSENSALVICMPVCRYKHSTNREMLQTDHLEICYWASNANPVALWVVLVVMAAAAAAVVVMYETCSLTAREENYDV